MFRYRAEVKSLTRTLEQLQKHGATLGVPLPGGCDVLRSFKICAFVLLMIVVVMTIEARSQPWRPFAWSECFPENCHDERQADDERQAYHLNDGIAVDDNCCNAGLPGNPLQKEGGVLVPRPLE